MNTNYTNTRTLSTKMSKPLDWSVLRRNGFNSIWIGVRCSFQWSVIESNLRVEPKTNEHILSTPNASTVSPIRTLARIFRNCDQRKKKKRVRIMKIKWTECPEWTWLTSSGNSTISNVLDKSSDNPNVNAMTTALEATIVYIKNRFSLSLSINGWPYRFWSEKC